MALLRGKVQLDPLKATELEKNKYIVIYEYLIYGPSLSFWLPV